MFVKKKNKRCLPRLAKVPVRSGGLTAEHHLFAVLRMSTGCMGVLSVHDLFYLLVFLLQPLSHQLLYCLSFFPIAENKLAPLPSFRSINERAACQSLATLQ